MGNIDKQHGPSQSELIKTLGGTIGRRCECSNAEFEHRALVLLQSELHSHLIDTQLVELLTDAVRLCREYTDAMNR